MNQGGFRTLSLVALGALTVGLAIGPRTALAGSWYTLATDGKELILVDLASVDRLPGGTFTVDQEQIYSNAGLMHVPGVSIPVRRQSLKLEVDCKKKQSRLIELTMFGENRDPIGHGTASGQQAAWMPSGSGYASPNLFEATCGAKPDQKDIHAESDVVQIQQLYVTATSEKK